MKAGAEAEAIATAPVAAYSFDIYPLINPLQIPGGIVPPFNPLQWLGNLSPWRSSEPGRWGLPYASPQIPLGCELEQVHLLSRHGARYPSTGEAVTKFGLMLQEALLNGTGFEGTGPLTFLNSWQYKLGAEILTAFGRKQM